MPGTAGRYLARLQEEGDEEEGERERKRDGRGKILKRDRYASFPVLSSFSNTLSTIASFSSFSSLASASYFFLFPHSRSYILGRSFHPLGAPLRCTLDARVYCMNSCWKKAYTFTRGYMCVLVYVAPHGSHVTYRGSRADATPSVLPLVTL